MPESGDGRVAVYFDFDNIVISRYDQVHGRSQFMRDRGRGAAPADPDFAAKLEQARVDVGAIIDYASSFGTLVLTRAYADWSAAVNADYRGQLVSRAVDLVQLFPAAAYAKNGADIRLAVDAVEDMFRLPDLTHVVVVAGDSDYIALAQRCRRLGRYVVGIGVAGSTSRSLAAACDELVTYDALPGVTPDTPAETPARTPRARQKRTAAAPGASPEAGAGQSDDTAGARPSAVGGPDGANGTDGADAADGRQVPPRLDPVFESGLFDDGRSGSGSGDTTTSPEEADEAATRLLDRALQLGHEKDDAEWLHSSVVKSQMKRMDPSFNEKALGFRSFSDFLRSRGDVAELEEESSGTRLRRVVRTAPRRRKAAARKQAKA